MTDFASPEASAEALKAMIAHLTGPLDAGAEVSGFDPDAAGAVALPPARLPFLQVTLRAPLGWAGLTVGADLDGTALDPLRFAPFSPEGSALLLWVGGEATPAMTCTLQASRDGAAVDPAEISGLVRLDMVEGNLGRILAVLGDEKARLRREASCLGAMRRLTFATGDALDRLGNDLGVPRLTSVLAWDGGRHEIVSIPGDETDADYRRRLAVWRPFLAPTPAAVRALLGQVDPRVTVEEPGGPLAAAIRVVGASEDAVDPLRRYLLTRVRADRLVFLADAAPGNAIHAARPQSVDGRAEDEAMRGRLAQAFAADADAAAAPRLAAALDRAARVLIALGADPMKIARAQNDAGGSRYELGMGVAVTLPAEAAAEALLTAALDPVRVPGDDAEAEALIRQIAADSPEAGDRTLDWLWAVVGLATRHRLDADHVYLSHLTSGGLTVETEARNGLEVDLRATFNAPEDTGKTAALQASLAEALGQGLPVALLAEADVPAALAAARDPAPGDPANAILAAVGLPTATGGVEAAAALARIPSDLWAVLSVEDGLAARITAGNPDTTAPLAEAVEALRRSGIAALLPIATAAGWLLVAGAVSLPKAGVNLGERIATGARWVAIPLRGTAALSAASGFTTRLRLSADGLAVVVALGYVRGAAPDPYELRIDMAEGELLDLAGYERVMNALERIFAIGVEVNTWRLRQHHVDLDGDGMADALPPRLARSYRSFRVPRARGLEEPEALAGVPPPP